MVVFNRHLLLLCLYIEIYNILALCIYYDCFYMELHILALKIYYDCVCI